MDNKGFTLLETLAVIFIVSIISISIMHYVGNTLSIDKDRAFKLFKDNIVSSAYDYIFECDNGSLKCNYVWNNDSTSFNAIELVNNGYFNKLTSPIDNRDLSNCLIINASRDNGNVFVKLIDNCY